MVTLSRRLYVVLFSTIKLVELHSRADARSADFRASIKNTAWGGNQTPVFLPRKAEREVGEKGRSG